MLSGITNISYGKWVPSGYIAIEEGVGEQLTVHRFSRDSISNVVIPLINHSAIKSAAYSGASLYILGNSGNVCKIPVNNINNYTTGVAYLDFSSDGNNSLSKLNFDGKNLIAYNDYVLGFTNNNRYTTLVKKIVGSTYLVVYSRGETIKNNVIVSTEITNHLPTSWENNSLHCFSDDKLIFLVLREYQADPSMYKIYCFSITENGCTFIKQYDFLTNTTIIDLVYAGEVLYILMDDVATKRIFIMPTSNILNYVSGSYSFIDLDHLPTSGIEIGHNHIVVHPAGNNNNVKILSIRNLGS
jgi:hypothetical protein